MKKIFAAALLSTSVFGFSQDAPKVNKTAFTKDVLEQKITSTDGKKLSVAEILDRHKGKIVVIDFWASWCQDCLKALPQTVELKKDNPGVDFIYFSLDRSLQQWKNGIEKHDAAANENYWFDEGWKNKFNTYVDLNWIPRFLVIDQTGAIAKYYSVSPADPELLTTLKNLQSVKK